MLTIINRTFAFFILIVFSPVILLTALCILFSMGWPIFFVQKRPGFQGKSFNLIKFRTMAILYDANGQILSDAMRLTNTGKWIRRLSIDELPQMINIIKGDMNFIGPRPLLMEYLPLYSEEQMRRHDVNPGITGWAQVNGRNAISWDEKFILDVWYVDNKSLRLDILIIWLTIKNIVKREGVSQAGHVTAEKFQGNGK